MFFMTWEMKALLVWQYAISAANVPTVRGEEIREHRVHADATAETVPAPLLGQASGRDEYDETGSAQPNERRDLSDPIIDQLNEGVVHGMQSYEGCQQRCARATTTTTTTTATGEDTEATTTTAPSTEEGCGGIFYTNYAVQLDLTAAREVCFILSPALWESSQTWNAFYTEAFIRTAWAETTDTAAALLPSTPQHALTVTNTQAFGAGSAAQVAKLTDGGKLGDLFEWSAGWRCPWLQLDLGNEYFVGSVALSMPASLDRMRKMLLATTLEDTERPKWRGTAEHSIALAEAARDPDAASRGFDTMGYEVFVTTSAVSTGLCTAGQASCTEPCPLRGQAAVAGEAGTTTTVAPQSQTGEDAAAATTTTVAAPATSATTSTTPAGTSRLTADEFVQCGHAFFPDTEDGFEAGMVHVGLTETTPPVEIMEKRFVCGETDATAPTGRYIVVQWPGAFDEQGKRTAALTEIQVLPTTGTGASGSGGASSASDLALTGSDSSGNDDDDDEIIVYLVVGIVAVVLIFVGIGYVVNLNSTLEGGGMHDREEEFEHARYLQQQREGGFGAHGLGKMKGSGKMGGGKMGGGGGKFGGGGGGGKFGGGGGKGFGKKGFGMKGKGWK